MSRYVRRECGVVTYSNTTIAPGGVQHDQSIDVESETHLHISIIDWPEIIGMRLDAVICTKAAHLYHNRNDRTLIKGAMLSNNAKGRKLTRKSPAQGDTHMMLMIKSLTPSEPPDVRTNMQATILTIKVPARISHSK